MWTQVVGKVKLKLTPFLNEWWGVGFHVSSRGLSSGVIPVGDRLFEMNFDFIDHKLYVRVSDGQNATLSLYPRSVADFYLELCSRLRSLGIEVTINTKPVETVPDIPFELDSRHASYDPGYVHDWWKVLTHTTRVMQRYRSTFVGKSSPILFYWGSFDLSCARYSGRPAPMPPVGPRFFKIGEDQENVCSGFWPGNSNARGLIHGKPAFYSYTYPAPKGFERASVRPAQAYFNPEFGEFLLEYDDLLKFPDPDEMLLEFFQSAYEAGATLGNWDRSNLEQTLESLISRSKEKTAA